MDRKAELEKKRRKLEELRKAKELKKQAKEAEKQSHVSQTATEQPDPVDELAKERKDVSLLVDSLIGHEPAAGEVSEKSPEPRSGAVSAEPVETLHSRADRRSRLTTSTVAQTNILPVDRVLYAKGTQTTETTFTKDEEEGEKEEEGDVFRSANEVQQSNEDTTNSTQSVTQPTDSEQSC